MHVTTKDYNIHGAEALGEKTILVVYSEHIHTSTNVLSTHQKQ